MNRLEKEHFKGRGGGSRRSGSGNGGSGNGGIGGSGIFGMIGTTVQCPASDNSYYCNFMKFIQVVMWIGILLFIIYFFYSFIMAGKAKKR